MVMVTPPGNVSAKLTLLKLAAVGLFNVNVIIDVAPGAIAAGANDFWIVMLDGPIIFAIRVEVEKSEL